MRRLTLGIAAAIVPAVAHAQPNGAPVSVLLGAGAGSAPDLTTSWAGPVNRAAALAAVSGVRIRPISRVFVDATADLTGMVLTGDDLAIAPLYEPGFAYARIAPRYASADAFMSAQMRAGIEVPASDGLVRASAGGGYMWEVREPFAAIGAGIGTSGHGVRFTLDLEHRRFRVPMEDFTVTPAAPHVPVVTRTRKEGMHSTYVRAGLEIPLGR